MPFGLLNSGSSFCCLMEMCLGDQQFVNLLLYLDDICILAANFDEMLDCIEMVFQRPKNFNLEDQAKKMPCLSAQCCIFRVWFVCGGISGNPKKVEKVQNWGIPTSPKELYSFLCLASYYRCFITNFTATAKCLHELVDSTHVEKDKKTKVREPKIQIFH